MYHRKYRIQFREGEINSLCIILIVSNIMIRKFYKIFGFWYFIAAKNILQTYTKRDKMCNIDKNLRVDFISTLLSITNNFRSILKNNNVYVVSFLQSSKEPEVIDFKTRSIVNDQRGGRRKGLWKKKEQTRIVSKGYSVADRYLTVVLSRLLERWTMIGSSRREDIIVGGARIKRISSGMATIES